MKKTFFPQNMVKLKNFVFLTYRTFSNLSETDVINKSNSLHVLRVIYLFGISLVLRRFVLISHWTNQIFHRKSGHAPIVVKFELLCVSEFIWVLLTTRPILLTIRSTKSQHFIDSCVMNTLSRLGLLEIRCL